MKQPCIIEGFVTNIKVISEKTIDEAKGLKEAVIKVLWNQKNKINSNGRLYTEAVLQRTIGDLNSRTELAKNRRGLPVYGMPFHPKDGIGDLTQVSHIINKVWMEEDGSCWGEATVLSNSLGQIIQTLYEKGPIGASCRGFGTMTEKKMKLEGKMVKYYEINDDYQCATPFDFVIRPSVKSAGTYESEQQILEDIQQCEIRLNENVSLIDPKKEDKMKKLKDLKDEHPEIYKLHEDVVAEKDTTIAEKDTAIAKKETRITELEAELKAEKEKIKTLGEENADLTEAKDAAETALNGIKDVVDTALETEEDPDKGNKPSEGDKGDKGDAKLKEDLKTSTEKVVKLEAEIQKRDDETVKAKLTKEITAKVTEELGKDGYKVYKALIEKRLYDKDGKLTVEIESVDKVGETIKSINDEISATITEGKKLEITTDTDEKGKVHPEGKTEVSDEQVEALYDEAVASGYSKSIEEFKKTLKKEQ
jgi:hypothetical protein